MERGEVEKAAIVAEALNDIGSVVDGAESAIRKSSSGNGVGD